MDIESDAEMDHHPLSKRPESEDSGEATSQEDLPVTSWKDLTIIDHVGLNSAEMSEKDLEAAFAQIGLAFRSDQYTLKQRLQAGEHARNLAEENIELELRRGRETLETLRGLCLDSERSKILQKLQLSLDILSWTVERISNTAEVLGAVHQEARVSRAMELMVAHVENLQRRLDKTEAAVKEIQKPRPVISPTASPEGKKPNRNQNSSKKIRRRVSMLILSNLTQEKKMQRSYSLKPDSSSSEEERKLISGMNFREKQTKKCSCCRQRPLVHWFQNHCWAALGLYLLVLSAGVTLTFYLFKHNDEALKL